MIARSSEEGVARALLRRGATKRALMNAISLNYAVNYS